MLHSRIIGLLIVAALGFAPSFADVRNAPPWTPDLAGAYATDSILVRFDSGLTPQMADDSARTGDEAIDAILGEWGVVDIGSVFSAPPQHVDIARRLGLDRTYVVRVPLGTDTPAMVAALADVAGIELVELNAIGTACEVPDDPKFSSLWGMKKIQAPEAWDIWTGTDNSIVAILDTGVDKTHSDLQDKLLPGWNTIKKNDNYNDGFGHGTHCAGTAAGIGNNGIGVVGVTWAGKILPVKVLSDQGSGSFQTVADGIVWATDHDANVVSMSLGFFSKGQVLEDAVNYAWEAGVVVVAAAGNESSRAIRWPARYDNCICVSATTTSDALASFSCYGKENDLSAPGVGVYSTYYHNSYTSMDGTSMATPHVAGLATLIFSYNPSLTNAQVRQIMQDNADDLGSSGWDEKFGWGRINAYKALQGTPPPCGGGCGDSNCDGHVDFSDIDCFVAALISQDEWLASGGSCDASSYICVNDVNHDEAVDFGDIDAFVDALVLGGCQ